MFWNLWGLISFALVSYLSDIIEYLIVNECTVVLSAVKQNTHKLFNFKWIRLNFPYYLKYILINKMIVVVIKKK